MSPWQTYARIGVAIAGLACAGVVWATLGSRRTPAPVPPIDRLDPAAALETTGGEFQRVRDGELEFDVNAAQSLFYEDGSVRQRDVSITARNRGGRDFVVTAKEATSERNEQALQLGGDVALTASDGFRLATDRGSFDRATGIAASPGAVTFEKGGMSGSGVGMTYEQQTDILRVLDKAVVEMTNADGTPSLSFSSTLATLDRVQHVLLLDGDVRVRRGEQVIAGDRAVALLSDTLEVVTRIELRGRAQVEGGSTAVARMSARDIDLDYSADGAALQHVALIGDGRIVTGSGETASSTRIAGETVDVRLGASGAIEHLEGAGAVALDQAAGDARDNRRVTAQRLVLEGQPGRGTTEAVFSGDVQYVESAAGGVPGRTVTAASLRLSLADDVVRQAEFAGRVTFRDSPLEARAEQLAYRPAGGTLGLSGRDPRGRPRVEDTRLTVESDSIDVTLEPLQITARGTVKTALQPPAGGRRGGSGPSAGEGPTRMPGLLKQGELANVNAEAMTYASATGRATYTGNATLWQGETAIRGDTVVLDQSTGNLAATGAARSTLVMGSGRSSARAHQILYSDAERTIAYLSPPPAPTAAPGARAPGAAAPAGGGVSFSGPEGELRAERIDVFLNPASGGADRLVAAGSVWSTIGPRTLTGDRLTYVAADERYEVTGRVGAPVRLVESCRETVGRTLIFFKSTDRIIVDGDGRSRTRTEGRGACPPVVSR